MLCHVSLTRNFAFADMILPCSNRHGAAPPSGEVPTWVAPGEWAFPTHILLPISPRSLARRNMLRESRVPDGPCAGFTPHGHVPRPRALIRHSCTGRCGAFARRSWCGRITTTAPPLRRARRRRGHGGSQKGGYQGGCCATDGPHGATAVLRRARWGVRAAIALRTRSACAAAATPHGVATMETATLRGGARGGSEAQRSTDASTRQICAGRQGVRVPQSHHETRCADRAPATEAVVAVAAWWWRGGGRGGHGDRGVCLPWSLDPL